MSLCWVFVICGLCAATGAALLHSVYSRGEVSRVVRLVYSKGRMGPFTARDLSRFAMLVSYRPLARTGLAGPDRVRDARGGVQEAFGRDF